MENRDILLCRECHKLNPENARFCRQCGSSFTEPCLRILPPGTVLDKGRFTITGFIGKGGSAMTYRARKANFTSEMVLKEYYPDSLAARDPRTGTVGPAGPDREIPFEQGRRQFLYAANTLHTLTGIPNIAMVHDAFEDKGTAYMAEDFINGPSLAQILHSGKRFDCQEALTLMRPVIRAVSQVHSLGIIHRDIKPDNIMVAGSTPYLIDFGIAQNIRNNTTLSYAQYGPGGSGPSGGYTIGYAAPEQVTGNAREGAWTDVYGLAATLYRMITGIQPDDAKARLVEDRLPRPADIVPDIPAAQSDAIMRGLALDSVMRYQNAETFLMALEGQETEKKAPVVTGGGEKEPPEGGKDHFLGPWILIPIVCGLITILLVLFALDIIRLPEKKEKTSSGSESSQTAENTSEESTPPAEDPSEEGEEPAEDSSSEDEKPEEDPSEEGEEPAEETSETGTQTQEETKQENFYLASDVGVSGNMRIDGSPTVNPYVFGRSTCLRANIQSVRFLSSTEGRPSDAWDVSAGRDGTVWAYVKNGTDLYLAADGKIFLPANCTGLFSFYTSVTSIDFGDCVDTSLVRDMTFMFKQDEQLRTLDLSCFDTSGVVSFDRMFAQCRNMTRLDLSSFDTGSLTNMRGMFGHCHALVDLNLSSFDTSGVTEMDYLFYECTAIRTLDIQNFDTSSAITGARMFLKCTSLETLLFDTDSFRTSNMKNMHAMFSECSRLRYLDVSKFDTSRVTDMRNMFRNDESLTYLDVSGFNTSQVTDMAGMFKNCSGLMDLDLSGFDMRNVKDKEEMLAGTRWD